MTMRFHFSRSPRQLGILAFVLTLSFLFNVCAQAPAPSFTDANKLYEQQRFSEAAAAYEKLVEGGQTSPAVYFNLANAWFKAGKTGRAIAAYREAEKLAPRDPDIKANLQFARDQVQNSKPPAPTVLGTFLDRLTINEWALLASAVFWIWFVLLIVGQLNRDVAKTIRRYVIGAGIVSVVLIVCALLAAQRHFVHSAVVVVQEAVVRRGPFEESQSAFTLRDGAELTVLDKKGQWLQVADTANRLGWVPEAQIHVIQ